MSISSVKLQKTCVYIGAGGNHNLDLNLGMSPPSLGNSSKDQNEGCLQFHSGTYDVHGGRVKFKLTLFSISFRVSVTYEKPKFRDVLEEFKSVQIQFTFLIFPTHAAR